MPMSSRIALLHDARAAQGGPDARDVLVEAEAVADALRHLGHAPALLPVGLDLAALEERLTRLAPHVVFNLVESLDGRGRLIHVVPALLASFGWAYTGCSASAQCLTSNKLLAKRLLLGAGLPTPALLEPGADAPAWIVKSVWEHASLGLDDSSVVTEKAAAEAARARRCAEHGGEWFAEAFVPGRELNVAVITSPSGPRVLPVAEIRFVDFPPHKPAIVGYAAKWQPASFEYRHTERSFGVEPALAARAERLALDCWRLFGLEGYARVDLRIEEGGSPVVLEINANPCLSPDAGFAAALEAAGIDFERAVEWLLAAASSRAGREGRDVRHS